MIATLEALANGMIAAGFIIAALFFLRFWRDSRDTLFIVFSASFFVSGLNTIALALVPHPNAENPWNYLVGLWSSLLILAAIINKNRSRS